MMNTSDEALPPPKDKSLCGREKCRRKATRYPVLSFWIDERHMKGPAAPALAHFRDLRTCDPCALTLEIQDVMNDEGWRTIVKMFVKAKRAIPERRLTELEWVEL